MLSKEMRSPWKEVIMPRLSTTTRNPWLWQPWQRKKDIFSDRICFGAITVLWNNHWAAKLRYIYITKYLMLIVDIPSLIVEPFTESEGGREQKVEKGFESGNCIGLSNNRHLRKIFVRKSTAWQISHFLVNFMTNMPKGEKNALKGSFLLISANTAFGWKRKAKSWIFHYLVVMVT